jgi:hypothetical protein
MEFNAENPRKVDSLTLFHDAESEVTAAGEPNNAPAGQQWASA